MNDENIELYEELISFCDDINDYVKETPTYHSQFKFTELNKNCYFEIYNKIKDIIPKNELYKDIPNLENECKSCWKHYLKPRNKSVRIFDLMLGKKFEKKLIDFLNLKGYDCRKGDEKNKKFPDNLLYKNNSEFAYIEIKYQSSPWLFAFKEEGSNRECYEASPALDIKKLQQQYELIKNNEINIPIYYLYWLDFPCIKGLYFISIDDVMNFYNTEAVIFDRKERDGDFKINKSNKKQKISATKKIHISVLDMKPFSELLNEIKND